MVMPSMFTCHQLFASILILLVCTPSCTPSSLARRDTWTSNNGTRYRIHQIKEGLKICSGNKCKYIRYADVTAHYSGLFSAPPSCPAPPFSQHESASSRLSLNRRSATERSDIKTVFNCCDGQSDGDRCCETVQCSYTPGIYETDINGVDYYVLHFTGIRSYQIVPIGQCGDKLNCDGHCMQMEAVHSLLVIDPSCWSWMSFKYFYFPSHCACHG